jgi:hypothetical protein
MQGVTMNPQQALLAAASAIGTRREAGSLSSKDRAEGAMVTTQAAGKWTRAASMQDLVTGAAHHLLPGYPIGCLESTVHQDHPQLVVDDHEWLAVHICKRLLRAGALRRRRRRQASATSADGRVDGAPPGGWALSAVDAWRQFGNERRESSRVT